MLDRFKSLIERKREPESRVHKELTEKSRERLAAITGFTRGAHKQEAFADLANRVGPSEIDQYISSDISRSVDTAHTEFLLEAETLLALSYIEFLMNIAHEAAGTSTKDPYTHRDVGDRTLLIIDVFETEGLLWTFKETTDVFLQFEELASERMKEADNELRSLAMDEKWEDALKGYNAAFNLYLDGKYSKEIPEKLYNSIEEVLQTICVDLEGWTDNRDQSHSVYLNLLREHEIYKAHGITNSELELLLDSLTKLVNKVGGDRKQRHEYIDRQYCTLLIHQVAAYLYFLINRYEDWSE